MPLRQPADSTPLPSSCIQKEWLCRVARTQLPKLTPLRHCLPAPFTEYLYHVENLPSKLDIVLTPHDHPASGCLRRLDSRLGCDDRGEDDTACSVAVDTRIGILRIHEASQLPVSVRIECLFSADKQILKCHLRLLELTL